MVSVGYGCGDVGWSWEENETRRLTNLFLCSFDLWFLDFVALYF